VNRLAADFAITACGLVGSAGLSLLVTVITARAVGVEEFGLYSFAFAYVCLWAPLMDGGASLLAAREVARGRGREVLAGLLALKPAQLAVSLVVLIGAAALAGLEARSLWLVTLLAVGSAVDTCFGLASAAFRGQGRFARDTLYQLGQRSFFAVLAAAVLATGNGVVGVAAARAASVTVATAAAFRLLHQESSIAWGAARRWFHHKDRASLGPLWSMLIVDLMGQLLTRTGPLVLRATRGLAEVGLYSAAGRLVEGLSMLPTAFGVALLPRFTAPDGPSPDTMVARMRAALRQIATLGVIVVGPGLIWADELMVILYGPSYAASAEPFRLLMGALLLAMVNSVLRVGLIAADAERVYAVGMALAAACAIGLNVVLAPRWGASGSAVASLCAEALLCAVGLAALRRRHLAVSPWLDWGGLALGSLACVAAIWAVKLLSPAMAATLTIIAVGAGGATLSPLGLRTFVGSRRER
jgi:O-antigen/teichoic acid export membrane protein